MESNIREFAGVGRVRLRRVAERDRKFFIEEDGGSSSTLNDHVEQQNLLDAGRLPGQGLSAKKKHT